MFRINKTFIQSGLGTKNPRKRFTLPVHSQNSIVKQLEKEKNNNFKVENFVVMFRCLDNGMYIYFCKLIVKSHIYYIIPHVHRIHIRIGGVMISVLASSADWGWVRAVPSYPMGTLGMCPGPHEHRDPCYFVYVVYIMLCLMFKH